MFLKDVFLKIDYLFYGKKKNGKKEEINNNNYIIVCISKRNKLYNILLRLSRLL